MPKLVFIGEAMLELRSSGSGELHQDFAGDVYNSAVYAKRALPEGDVYFCSGVGEDAFSKQFVKACAGHGVATDYLFAIATSNIGIYSIQTDAQGERSFSYWRKGSAASQLFTFADDASLQYIAQATDIIYFSGITLAIYSAEQRSRFWGLLEQWRQAGAKIAFDPNYRPALWDTKESAIAAFEQAYQLSDWVFPGLEDHQALWGHNNQQDILDFLLSLQKNKNTAALSFQGVVKQGAVKQGAAKQESVIKCGEKGSYVYLGDRLLAHQPFMPAPKQVDATAAGDSFAGTYLAVRANDLALQAKGLIDQATLKQGELQQSALKQASDVARDVVQHPGAIAPIM